MKRNREYNKEIKGAANTKNGRGERRGEAGGRGRGSEGRIRRRKGVKKEDGQSRRKRKEKGRTWEEEEECGEGLGARGGARLAGVITDVRVQRRSVPRVWEGA